LSSESLVPDACRLPRTRCFAGNVPEKGTAAAGCRCHYSIATGSNFQAISEFTLRREFFWLYYANDTAARNPAVSGSALPERFPRAESLRRLDSGKVRRTRKVSFTRRADGISAAPPTPKPAFSASPGCRCTQRPFKEVVILKIEKISDMQIKCILTDSDLKNRSISPSELAYGSEKIRNLFREMLTQAARDVGFSVENVPLMIEAVPEENSSLVILITKVSDPEEVDTRFAKFTPADTSSVEDDSSGSDQAERKGADDVLDTLLHSQTPDSGGGQDGQNANADFYLAWHFADIDTACRAAHVIDGLYDEDNTLYRDPDQEGACILVMHKGSQSPEDFNRLYNIISEYGDPVHRPAAEAWLAEHAEVISAHHAVQVIKNL
jgi:adapter protein MecA 1/2